MAVAQRIESLRSQHAAVESALRSEMSHAWHDDTRVKQLKARKLRLRDAISQLRTEQDGREEAVQRRRAS
jgi:hypothetical protein